MKLINLFHYEARRETPASWATRLANAAGVCGDDHTIRAAARADGSVALTQVDLDRSETQVVPGDSDAQQFLDAFLLATEESVLAKQRASVLRAPPDLH